MEIKARSSRPDDLKEYLLGERLRLSKEIAASDTTTDDERSGYSTHMADDASMVIEQEMNVGHKRDQERLLADVDDAPQRMADGSYGVCRRCGQAIDGARLRAMPMASHCFHCQDLREHR